MEPAAAVCAGGGVGCGQHRPGGRGNQLGPGRTQATAGRRFSSLERALRKSCNKVDFYFCLVLKCVQEWNSQASENNNGI